MRYIVYNDISHTVYYKGYTSFGFYEDSSDLNKWKNEMYDNYDSAKRALRKLRKTDMKFYKVICPTAKKENWKMAMVEFTVSFTPMQE